MHLFSGIKAIVLIRLVCFRHFYKEDNFSYFLFVTCTPIPFWKRVYTKRKAFSSPFEKGTYVLWKERIFSHRKRF